MKHDTGAKLDRRSAQQKKLDRIMRSLDAADAAYRYVFRQTQCELTDHAQRNWFDGLRRVAARHRVAFDRRHWAKRVQIDAYNGENRIDGRDADRAAAHGSQRGFLDVGNVRRHLGPDGNLRDFGHPACDLFGQIWMFAHLRSHLAFGHAMRAREVELECIHARVLDHARQFLPAALFILFHDRGYQHMIRILLFDLAKLVEPDFNRAIGNQLDVFEANDLAGSSRSQFPVTRNDVDNLGGFQANSLCDRAAPAGFV